MKVKVKETMFSGFRFLILLTIIPVFGGCSLLGHPSGTIKGEVKSPAPAVERYEGDKSRKFPMCTPPERSCPLPLMAWGPEDDDSPAG